jgi:hypothetical protein
MDFHNTRMGQKFFAHDVPELLETLKKIAEILERSESSKNEQKEFNNKMLDRGTSETKI